MLTNSLFFKAPLASGYTFQGIVGEESSRDECADILISFHSNLYCNYCKVTQVGFIIIPTITRLVSQLILSFAVYRRKLNTVHETLSNRMFRGWVTNQQALQPVDQLWMMLKLATKYSLTLQTNKDLNVQSPLPDLHFFLIKDPSICQICKLITASIFIQGMFILINWLIFIIFVFLSMQRSLNTQNILKFYEQLDVALIDYSHSLI